MLCQFQVSSKVNQLYIYIHPPSRSFPIEAITELPVLDRTFLLVICFIYNSMYMSMKSPFLNTSFWMVLFWSHCRISANKRVRTQQCYGVLQQRLKHMDGWHRLQPPQPHKPLSLISLSKELLQLMGGRVLSSASLCGQS